MSLYDYKISQTIASEGFPFHALIMAAARKADSFNFSELERAFPGTIAELQLRYNAPGGLLPQDGPVVHYEDEDPKEVEIALLDGRRHD